jgi:DNA-binding XRE family transcriptional regulator
MADDQTRWISLDEVLERDKDRIDWGRVEVIRERMRAEERAYQLTEIRKAHGLTQTDIARQINVSQRRVSAVEHGDLARTEVGTIAAYVQALGGHLRLVADFGDQSVTIG